MLLGLVRPTGGRDHRMGGRPDECGSTTESYRGPAPSTWCASGGRPGARRPGGDDMPPHATTARAPRRSHTAHHLTRSLTTGTWLRPVPHAPDRLDATKGERP